MLQWAVVFFVVALISAVFGFGGMATAAMEAARILFFVFILLFLVAGIAHAAKGRLPPA